VTLATIGTVLLLGWLMVFSGIVEVVHGSHARRWGGFFVDHAGGVLGVLMGLLIVSIQLPARSRGYFFLRQFSRLSCRYAGLPEPARRNKKAEIKCLANKRAEF
jgi:hypothetical protein